MLNDRQCDYKMMNGYMLIDSIKDGDEINVNIDITPHKLYANSKIQANLGKCAFMAGPIIYCFEDIDNGDIGRIEVKVDKSIDIEKIKDKNLGNITILKMFANQIEQITDLYSFKAPKKKEITITAIPYYAWGNREEGKMKVWINEE